MASKGRDIVSSEAAPVAASGDRSKVFGSSNSKRLAVMPLAVLLPKLSSLSKLSEFLPAIEARLAALQEEEGKLIRAEGEGEANYEAEVSMLHQLVQWFRIGER